MQDISAGRDIIHSPITQIVGSNPSLEILQQPAEELAAAEKLSRTAVRNGRKRRAVYASIFTSITLVALFSAGLLGYFWLLKGGELKVSDLIHDASNITVAALVSTGVSALAAVVSGGLAFSQKDKSDAEKVNSARLNTIATRWDELKLLGFPKSDIRQLRKRK